MSERTFYITDYCPHDCKFCSSSADEQGMKYLPPQTVLNDLEGKHYDIINISGGEPLAHPMFWTILQACKGSADLVVVHTNALDAIMFNAKIIDGVQVEANLTVQDSTEKIHVLKRINQGREKTRPKVSLSHNYTGECKGDCGHEVMMPDGSIQPAPCRKEG